jgi:hypothetical protein
MATLAIRADGRQHGAERSSTLVFRKGPLVGIETTS